MKSIIRNLGLLLVLGFVASAAHADTMYTLTMGPDGCTPASCNGYQFKTTVDQIDSTDYKVTFRVTNINGPSAYLQGFGLTLFADTIDATMTASDPALSSDWTVTVVDNAKFNNGNNNCGNGSNGGSFCLNVDNNGSGYLLANANDFIQFDFDVTGGTSVLDSWHIMSNGTTTASGTGGGNVFALTDDGTPTTPPPPTVSEPGTLTLFGAGMLTLGQLVRRRSKKR